MRCCYGLGAISYALLGLGLSEALNRTNPLNKVPSQKGSEEHKLRYADLHGDPPTAHCVLSPRADNLHGAAPNCHLYQGLSPMDYFKFPKALKTFKNLSMQNWGGPRAFLSVAKLHGHKPKQELSSHSLNSYTRGAAEPVLATGRRSPTRCDWLSLFKTAVLPRWRAGSETNKLTTRKSNARIRKLKNPDSETENSDSQTESANQGTENRGFGNWDSETTMREFGN